MVERRFREAGFGIVEGEIGLVCPDCGAEYAHIRSAVATPQSDREEHEVVINVDGECGHEWRLTFHNHGGTTTVSAEVWDEGGRAIADAQLRAYEKLIAAAPSAIATLADLANNGETRESVTAERCLERISDVAELLGWRKVDGKWIQQAAGSE